MTRNLRIRHHCCGVHDKYPYHYYNIGIFFMFVRFRCILIQRNTLSLYWLYTIGRLSSSFILPVLIVLFAFEKKQNKTKYENFRIRTLHSSKYKYCFTCVWLLTSLPIKFNYSHLYWVSNVTIKPKINTW